MQEGLEHVIGRQQNAVKGYKIQFGICTRCGQEVATTSRHPYHCDGCQSTDESKFRATERHIEPKVVEDIINRKIYYVCPECKKQYDRPTRCCLAAKAVAPKSSDKAQPAWFCPGCRSIYYESVEKCCDGWKIHKGKALSDPMGIKRQIMRAI